MPTLLGFDQDSILQEAADGLMLLVIVSIVIIIISCIIMFVIFVVIIVIIIVNNMASTRIASCRRPRTGSGF